jgi:hypothetical protein
MSSSDGRSDDRPPSHPPGYKELYTYSGGDDDEDATASSGPLLSSSMPEDATASSSPWSSSSMVEDATTSLSPWPSSSIAEDEDAIISSSPLLSSSMPEDKDASMSSETSLLFITPKHKEDDILELNTLLTEKFKNASYIDRHHKRIPIYDTLSIISKILINLKNLFSRRSISNKEKIKMSYNLFFDLYDNRIRSENPNVLFIEKQEFQKVINKINLIYNREYLPLNTKFRIDYEKTDKSILLEEYYIKYNEYFTGIYLRILSMFLLFLSNILQTQRNITKYKNILKRISPSKKTEKQKKSVRFIDEVDPIYKDLDPETGFKQYEPIPDKDFYKYYTPSSHSRGKLDDPLLIEYLFLELELQDYFDETDDKRKVIDTFNKNIMKKQEEEYFETSRKGFEEKESIVLSKRPSSKTRRHIPRRDIPHRELPEMNLLKELGKGKRKQFHHHKKNTRKRNYTHKHKHKNKNKNKK